MSPAETPLVFECQGDRLIGIVARPGQPSPLGVLIVVGGPQYRAGSHRQFVHLARALARDGFPTFRFDCRGMGDSEGAMRTFEQIEPDIHAAVRAFRGACPGVKGIVAFGLCDAASAILVAAERIDGLAGMILANPWVRRSDTLNAAVVRHYYRERLLSSEFWRKLATGKLQVGSVAAEFLARVGRFIRGRSGDDEPTSADFVDRMRAGWQLPVNKLLLLSGRDITAREFEDVRKADTRWAPVNHESMLDEERYADADHTFSMARWQNEAAARCSQFLTRLTQLPANSRVRDPKLIDGH